MESTRKKREFLSRLVQKRRVNVPSEYKSVSSFHGGRYDRHGFVVPWTISAPNLNARLMIVAQDWASDEFLEEFDPEVAKKGYDESLQTNIQLFRLLKEFMHLNFKQTYATDVFPFIKRGNISAYVPFRDLTSAASEFALPQIEIVRPRMVVCLGIGMFNAIRVAIAKEHGNKASRLSWAAYDAQFRIPSSTTYAGAEIYAVTHLGGWSSMRRKKILPEWKRLSVRLAKLTRHGWA